MRKPGRSTLLAAVLAAVAGCGAGEQTARAPAPPSATPVASAVETSTVAAAAASLPAPAATPSVTAPNSAPAADSTRASPAPIAATPAGHAPPARTAASPAQATASPTRTAASPAQATASPAPATASFTQPVVPRERTRARVLMYHSIGWFSEQRPQVSPYSLRTQLEWLREHQIEVVRLSQLLDFLDGQLQLPERVAAITIDDGERNGYSVAYPIFRQHAVPFAVAVATDTIDRPTTRGTLTWEQIREMVGSGLCEVVSHSHTHANLTLLSDAELRRELTHSRDLIEHHAGVRPTSFVYPLGAYSARVKQLTEELGYRAAFAAQGGPVTSATPHFVIPRYAVEKHTSIFGFANFFSHRG